VTLSPAQEGAPTESPALPPGQRWLPRLALALVIVAAITAATISYRQFLPADRFLWGGIAHDRSAHYLNGLKLAHALKELRPLQFVLEVDRSRSWPPLHPILLSCVLLCGGFDYRLGVLPSLAGWAATAVFGFLAARRALPRGGNVAGLAAAILVLASPAHRAFATDIMLESLGACLSLAAVYFYIVWRQKQSVGAARCLGLALTALFLHKYNYWLLVALALGATTVLDDLARCRQLVRRAWALPWRRWFVAQWRQPLNYPLLASLLLLATIDLLDGRTMSIGARTMAIRSSENLVHVCYVAFLIRMLPWWLRTGRDRARQLPIHERPLIAWHFAPVVLWFLWPKRLYYFIWYLTRNHGRGFADLGWRYYWGCLTRDYHAGTWSVLVVAALAGYGLIRCRRLRPGGMAIVWFAAIGSLLTVGSHTWNSRFLHSWLAAFWLVAGIGLAQLCYARVSARLAALGQVLAAAALALLLLLELPAWRQPAHTLEAGFDVNRPSVLDLPDFYLPALADSQRSTILATLPMRYVAEWTFLERYGKLDRLETHWLGFGSGATDNRDGFRRWLETTACDTIVFVDNLPASIPMRRIGVQAKLHAELRDALEGQTAFRGVERREFPGLEWGCVVSIWRRLPAESPNAVGLAAVAPPRAATPAALARR
jgi:hypothetical protein